tara:strand:+ start:360 stop:638 length:279 start_codon:yes stop_codon:yes gene_type:complete
MVIDRIKNLLESNLNIHSISIDDLSNQHKNHNNDGGGHYKINLISDDFENISLLDRHKKIYLILKDMIKKEIHAVSLNLSTVKEYTKKSEAR